MQQHRGLLRRHAITLQRAFPARSVRSVEHILLIANAAAGTHEQEALQAALSVLQELSDVRI